MTRACGGQRCDAHAGIVGKAESGIALTMASDTKHKAEAVSKRATAGAGRAQRTNDNGRAKQTNHHSLIALG